MWSAGRDPSGDLPAGLWAVWPPVLSRGDRPRLIRPGHALAAGSPPAHRPPTRRLSDAHPRRGRVALRHLRRPALDYHARDSPTGGIVARAKRTARAEARRRYRAEHPLEADELDGVEDEADADAGADEAPPARRRSSSARPTESRDGGRPAGGRPARPSALRAFRDAYQPADIRADLRALPELIRSRAVTIPA